MAGNTAIPNWAREALENGQSVTEALLAMLAEKRARVKKQFAAQKSNVEAKRQSPENETDEVHPNCKPAKNVCTH